LVLAAGVALLLASCQAGGIRADELEPSELTTDAPQIDLALDSTPIELPDYPDAVELPSLWPLTPASLRTDDEVCGVWRELAAAPSTMPAASPVCAPEPVGYDERRAAFARLSYYRWLVGLDAVGEASTHLDALQACANYFALNELPLSHEPPADRACFTEPVAAYAGTSNLASGLSSAVDAVDLFVGDPAHRALALAPNLRATAFGLVAGVVCQLVFAENWSWQPPIHRTIAYPAPGPNAQPPTRKFSALPATGHDFDELTAVKVTLGDAEQPLSARLQDTGYGPKLLVFELANTPAVGAIYQVAISDIATAAGRTREDYHVRFVSCDE